MLDTQHITRNCCTSKAVFDDYQITADGHNDIAFRRHPTDGD
jgi:hypothetical protein